MPNSHASRVLALLGAAVMLVAGVVLYSTVTSARRDGPETPVTPAPESGRFMTWGGLTGWWDPMSADVRARSISVSEHENISPQAYAGPESCRECHEENYRSWSQHPHRWMNALANDDSVRGDFSGNARISYRGGSARFFREGGEYRMELQRGELRRLYQITQTIGSRFFQYYVGKGLKGPEPAGHEFYSVDHVLPFGYWLEYDEWVPTVHINSLRFGESNYSEEDVPSEQRPDPFDRRDGTITFVPYYNCNSCHTTFPLGDQFIRAPDLLGRHTPRKLSFSVGTYVRESHPELWPTGADPSEMPLQDAMYVMQSMELFEAPTHAVALGVTCEACHLGSREHAEGKLKKPYFFPRSPHLCIETDETAWDYGRTQVNVNWACGRCHAGIRTQLAAGMSTWNSTEFTDATRGSCYSQLKCIDCHNPHQATGPRWSKPAAATDRVCLGCHQQFEPAEDRAAHTHHGTDSEGSHCLDCHMPRVNEGLQDVVRTHMIYSPTESGMIESNQPNACNLCHTEQSIDWTLGYLRDWYEAEYSSTELDSNYADRSQPASLGWLQSDNHAVRLIAADALTRTNSDWATRGLIDALDDPFLLNRQFARRGLERMLNVRLRDYGYEFYMTPEERAEPLERIRQALLAPGDGN